MSDVLVIGLISVSACKPQLLQLRRRGRDGDHLRERDAIAKWIPARRALANLGRAHRHLPCLGRDLHGSRLPGLADRHRLLPDPRD